MSRFTSPEPLKREIDEIEDDGSNMSEPTLRAIYQYGEAYWRFRHVWGSHDEYPRQVLCWRKLKTVDGNEVRYPRVIHHALPYSLRNIDAASPPQTQERGHE